VSQLAVLARKDARVVYRDRFLLLLCMYAVLIALVARVVVPLLPVDRLAFYLAPAILSLAPAFLGSVLGFALVEEREQGTWLLLRVLPLRAATLLVYLSAGACGLAAVAAGLVALAYGHPVARPGLFAAMVVATALTTPIYMFGLGALARNKVEGLTVSKALNVVAFVPVGVFFVPPAWQVPLLGWSPFYWIYLGLLQAHAPDPGWLAAPLRWPGHPLPLLIAAPCLLSLLGTIGAMRLYRRRA